MLFLRKKLAIPLLLCIAVGIFVVSTTKGVIENKNLTGQTAPYIPPPGAYGEWGCSVGTISDANPADCGFPGEPPCDENLRTCGNPAKYEKYTMSWGETVCLVRDGTTCADSALCAQGTCQQGRCVFDAVCVPGDNVMTR